MTCCALQSEATEAGANYLVPKYSAHLVTHATVGCTSVALTMGQTFWWFSKPLALATNQSWSFYRFHLVVMLAVIFSFQVFSPDKGVQSGENCLDYIYNGLLAHRALRLIIYLLEIIPTS
jgi:hypothetical protein